VDLVNATQIWEKCFYAPIGLFTFLTFDTHAYFMLKKACPSQKRAGRFLVRKLLFLADAAYLEAEVIVLAVALISAGATDSLGVFGESFPLQAAVSASSASAATVNTGQFCILIVLMKVYIN
jgi:hypothetical protein